MCEITKQNFEEKYNQIIDDLHSALYIAIDCEFTGLFDDNEKCSLFDTPKTRFKKLQNCLKKFLIIQFGLSTFKYEREDNSFTASTYTFHLIPSPVAGNTNFSCETKSLEFLSKYNFDFNKSFRDGVYFLNKSDETKVLNIIEDGEISKNYDKEIQKNCSSINAWSVNAPVGSKMFLALNNHRQTFIYLLHWEIRKRFPQLWTYFEKDSLTIEKVNESKRRDLKKEEIILKKHIFDSVLGFSRIMKEIQNLKKPIVGHNFLIDLIKIYQQFYNPLPVTYTEFKKAVNDLFPNIYDTKHMSCYLKKLLTKEEAWVSNSLPHLYQYFRNGKGAELVICTPVINHKNKNYDSGTDFHEAGFDSYITGFCFLKMAHAFSLWNNEKQSFHLTFLPTSCCWLLGAVLPMKNQLNITRAQVSNIVLDGPDPKNIRPGLLYIQSKRNEPLDISKISELMAKYGSVDIQLLNKFSALMAMRSHKQLREILQSLQDTNEFVVYKYSFLKHSLLGKTIFSGIIIASGIFVTILILKKGKKI